LPKGKRIEMSKSEAVQKTVAEPSLINRMAAQYGVEPTKFIQALKQIAFKQSEGKEVTDQQLLCLMVIANQYNLNPFTQEIYAFPDKKGGITPIIGVNGWSKVINESKALDGIDFVYSEDIIEIDKAKKCPEWIECHIQRLDRGHPICVREYLEECYKDTVPWNTHTKRMLRHKALIQCAKIAFSLTGVYDEEEGREILMQNNIPENSSKKPITSVPVAKKIEVKAEEPIDISDKVTEIDVDTQSYIDELNKE
jgi:phage recombination protein Bet